jgi:hypothetical protein
MSRGLGQKQIEILERLPGRSTLKPLIDALNTLNALHKAARKLNDSELLKFAIADSRQERRALASLEQRGLVGRFTAQPYDHAAQRLCAGVQNYWYRVSAKAHQREVKEDHGRLISKPTADIADSVVREISHTEARAIIEKYEYLGTYANAPLHAFGIFFGGDLGGVVTYARPLTSSLRDAPCGPEYGPTVCQLARGACLPWAHEHSASRLIGDSLKQMAEKGYRLAIAFADPDAGEIGTVYQATNWTYCGLTENRLDYFHADGSRHAANFQRGLTAKLKAGRRTRKHRYVAFMGNRAEKAKTRAALRWKTADYSKRKN